MPRYERVEDGKVVERVLTRPGSREDKRLNASERWTLVTEPDRTGTAQNATPAAEQASPPASTPRSATPGVARTQQRPAGDGA